MASGPKLKGDTMWRLLFAGLCALSFVGHATAQTPGCQQGQLMYAGDWVQKGVKLSLVKTGANTGTNCSRTLTLEMVDDPRFHSNPNADSIAVIVQLPPSPERRQPYVMGQRIYNFSIELDLPCASVTSCLDYVGRSCDQQGIGFFYQLRMNNGCPGSNVFIGLRDNDTLDAPATDFTVDPTRPCQVGNSASYDNIESGLEDMVATLQPHPSVAGQCLWHINITLLSGPRFRDSDYLDFVSFRGVGTTNYGAAPRLFFKGQPTYTSFLGPAPCTQTELEVEVLVLNELPGQYPAYITGPEICPFQSYKLYTLQKDVHYSFGQPVGGNFTPGASPPPVVPPPSPTLPPATCSSVPAPPAAAVATVACINAGGPALCGFSADTGAAAVAVGGVAEKWVGGTAACSSSNPSLLCTVRFGAGFSYTFPTTAGRTYRVRLTIDEVYFDAAAQRVFDVLANGVVQLAGIDPFAAAGAKFVGITREFDVVPTSASLLLGFQGRVNNAIVAAVEVFDMGSGPVTPPVNPSPGPAVTPSPTPSPSPAPVIPGGLAAACTTVQPPQQLPCPAMLSNAEVVRGFGAFHDPTCAGGAGSWSTYQFPGGQSCCRTCRWNNVDAIAARLQPGEIPECPPCVKAYYEAVNNGTVTIVPLSFIVNNTKCPFPNPPGGDMSLPSWYYLAATDTCYYKSNNVKGYAGSYEDARLRCQNNHGGRLLKVTSAVEDDFVRLNLLWTGFFGETYMGLSKLGNLNPNFVNVWTWDDGSVLQLTDYQRWDTRPYEYQEEGPLCMEYLPQQPKAWNPFTCFVIKQYICERPAFNGTVVVVPSPSPATPPATTSTSPAPTAACSSFPAVPAGAVATVARINAGGPALCGFSADTGAAAVATAGTAENWVGGTAACSSTSPSLLCTVRFGGGFSYTFPTTAGKTYRVRLTIDEVYFDAPAQRVFDVLANGVVQLPGIDPFAEAGAKFVNVTRVFDVVATGASLLLTFQGRVNNAIVAAVEVFDMGTAPPVPGVSPPLVLPPVVPPPSPTPPPATCSSVPAPPAGAVATVARINAGGPALCGFSADTGAAAVATGGTAENWVGREPTCSSTSPSLLCTVRFGGGFSYTFPTTAGRTYRVRLTIDEVYFDAAAQRIFRVLANGVVQRSGIDAFAVAGAKFVAVPIEFDVVATSASLLLGFQAQADNAIVAAVEVFDMGVLP